MSAVYPKKESNRLKKRRTSTCSYYSGSCIDIQSYAALKPPDVANALAAKWETFGVLVRRVPNQRFKISKWRIWCIRNDAVGIGRV